MKVYQWFIGHWTLGSLVDVACNFSGKEVRNGARVPILDVESLQK
jgi:hypothetical protein